MAELFRRELGPDAVARIALYILLRLAERGYRIVETERLVKLLFFALYTEPGPDLEPVLSELPPKLSGVEFRIYLRGPYMRIRELVERMNKAFRALVGIRDARAVLERSGLLTLTSIAAQHIDTVVPVLRSEVASALGEEFVRKLDEWVIERLSELPPKLLTEKALRVLHLETVEKKAMVFNMSLDDYINMLTVLKSVREDLERGTLRPDYDLYEVLEGEGVEVP